MKAALITSILFTYTTASAWANKVEIICNYDKPDYSRNIIFDTTQKTVTDRGLISPVILANDKYILWLKVDEDSAQLNGYDIARQLLYYRQFHIGFDQLAFSESVNGLNCKYP